MALRDQPYLPLYVQDVLTDEKLIECSAESHGVYFRLLCLLHKQEKYGLICLKQKYKQKGSKIQNFASMLAKQMPFGQKQIEDALIELFNEGVINITEDELSQKRMVHDGNLSLIRSTIGKKGGSNITKQYGKSGYLYLMSDTFDFHKIGISINPKNRLYRLRSDLNLPKNFDIIEQIEVSDMGGTEDLAHTFFGDKMDGEWIKDSYSAILEKFVLFKAKLQAKTQANTQANTENENETETETIINYNGVLENFHLYCDRMSKVSKLSDQRKKHIAARFKEFNYDTIIEVIKKAGKSNFLCGVNGKTWKADFDWIFNPANFLKIMEGKYDNKNNLSPTDPRLIDDSWAWKPIKQDATD